MNPIQVGAYHFDPASIAYVWDGRKQDFGFVTITFKGSTNDHPLTITLTKEDEIEALFSKLYGETRKEKG